MPRTWIQIRVELISGRDIVCEPPPGRIMMVGPGHTFAALAEAIDAAFARWDLAHLHGFELGDGRLLGIREAEMGDEWLDDDAVTVAAEVGAGDEFVYTFDFGDDWRHRCLVLPDKVDPRAEYGSPPRRPVPLWGWGWIPDQYGRETFEDIE